MAFKVNWKTTCIASGRPRSRAGVIAAASVLVYYLLNREEEEEEEKESYKQTYSSASLSSSRVDKMSKKECVDFLKLLVKCQNETKALVESVIRDVVGGKLPAKLADVYDRVLPLMPADPLEAWGMNLFDVDHLVEKYQNEPAARECMFNIMNVMPPRADDPDIPIDDLVAIHEYMLGEMEKQVAAYRKLPYRASMDRRALTLALQAIVSARVEEKFGFDYSTIDRAIAKNHSELSINTKFARLSMQMQSEMSEISG